MRRLQHVHRRLQVDHEVRHRRVDGQARIHLLVERKFLVVQGQPREQAVLVEQVIGDAHGLEQVGLAQLLQLTRTLEQEVQLGLERGSARVAIEALEKRVFVVLLEHEFAAEAARQAVSQDSSCRPRSVLRRRYSDVRWASTSTASATVVPSNVSVMSRSVPTRWLQPLHQDGTLYQHRAGRVTVRFPRAAPARSRVRQAPACGTVIAGSARRVEPWASRSRSISRGPQRTIGAARPSWDSSVFRCCSSARASSCVSSPATAFTKSGCVTGPIGRER